MRNFLLLIPCFIVCSACTKRINIDTDNAAPRLVIVGHITTDTLPHLISVSQTANYFGDDDPKVFSNALVKINGTPLYPLGDGRYSTDASFFGVPGQTYELDVALDYDGDGASEHYTAQTTVPPMHDLDSISLHLMPSPGRNEPVWILAAHFQDQPGPNMFGAHLYINNIKYTDKLRHYYLNGFGEAAAEGQYINFPIFYISGHELGRDKEDKIPLYTGDTITFELNNMDAAYFDFLRAAKLEINDGNPLFAGPPANAPGNISGGALGIFGAYTASRKFIVLEEKHGFPQRPAAP
jgi:hypothetical protein